MPNKVRVYKWYKLIISTQLQLYFAYRNYICGDMYDLTVSAENKVVIVTGANTGIGKETAWELARRGAKVYMACRDLKKCEEVLIE